MLIRTGICRRWIRIWWWCRFWMLGDGRRRRARRSRLGLCLSKAEDPLKMVSGLPSGGGCYGIEAGEIDDNRLRTAANDDPGDGLGGGIQFLVRKVGGNENKVTGTHGFGRFA